MERKILNVRPNLFVIKNPDEKYSVFDAEKGDIWEVNHTGAFIVECLIQGTSLADIVAKIKNEYEIDAKEAEKSLDRYLEDLEKIGIMGA